MVAFSPLAAASADAAGRGGFNVNRHENKVVGHVRIAAGLPLAMHALRGDASAPSQKEVAEYIASMLESLARVAGSAGMPFLVYLINVALEEAKVEKATRD